MKAVPREVFIAINVYIKIESQINSLTVCLKERGKEEQTKPKTRRKAITKIKAEIKELANRRQNQGHQKLFL